MIYACGNSNKQFINDSKNVNNLNFSNVMIKILVYLIGITSLQYVYCINNIIDEYDPPHNIRYPFGDESQFNFNVLDKTSNPFPCEDTPSIDKVLGKCPLDIPKRLPTIENPFIECPDYAILPSPIDIDNLPNSRPNPDVLCKTCDLKLSPDSLSVLLECNSCLDLPSPVRTADTVVKDLLYKVFFVQIANYTSVEVTGSEYFNP